MVFHTASVASSVADDDYGGMAYIYCVDWSGYCLSLSRHPDADLVEVLVDDQRVHRTAEVTAELHSDKLVVRLSPSAAASLDGVAEYVVPLSVDPDELRELDAALVVIFATAGRYDRRF
jgi:hypothetical protein